MIHLLVLALAQSADTHPFSVHDMLAMERLSGWEVSPDGRSLLFEQRTTDLDANRGRLDLWLVGADGNGLRRLTTNEANDSSPRWLPDGRSFVFLSTRSGSSQVWRMSLDGGEATQVTNLPLDVDNLKVFPDGKHLMLGFAVKPDAPAGKELVETAASDELSAKSKVKAQIYDTCSSATGTAGTTASATTSSSGTIGSAAPRDLMPGMDADSPPKPFGGTEEIDDLARRQERRLHRARARGREAAWTTNLNLSWSPADGSPPALNLTADNKAQDTSPSFSPDGKRLAWLAHGAPGLRVRSPAHRADGRRAAEGLAQRVLTEAWDRVRARSSGPGTARRSSPPPTTSGSTRSSRSTSRPATAQHARRAGHDLGPGGNRRRARPVRARHARRAARALQRRGRGGATTQLTHVERRAAIAKTRARRASSSSRFKGANGDTVYGYVVQAGRLRRRRRSTRSRSSSTAARRARFGNHFHYRWNPQVYAGARLRRGDDRLPRLDRLRPGLHRRDQRRLGRHAARGPDEGPRRGAREVPAGSTATALAALGASYGGYMINWIDGPDRPLQVPRLPRRQPRRAHGLLRHRGAVVPRVGARRHAVGATPRATRSTTRSTS